MTNEIYHIYNRGVGGKNLYRDARDFIHFLACLKEFNTTDNIEMRFINNLRRSNLRKNVDSKKIIEILGFCLMTNHYHIIIKQIVDDGIRLYMQKIGTGYTMYFNERHKSEGHIFQGKYRIKRITTGDQLIYTSVYIHINPIKSKKEDLMSVTLDQKLLKKILQYPWSSINSYCSPGYKVYEHPELEYSKPIINTNIVQTFLGSTSYLYFLTDVWGKDLYNLEIDKKMA